MTSGSGLIVLALFALWVWAIFDVLTTPKGAERTLPKIAWVIIVVLFQALGALAWVLLGRPRGAPIGFAGRGRAEDVRHESGALSDRERAELERREYYRQMDQELDRRLEEKRRTEGSGDS